MRLFHLPEWAFEFDRSPLLGIEDLTKISHRDTIGIEIYSVNGSDQFVASFPSGTQFLISMIEKTIKASAPAEVSQGHVEQLLIDQLVPRILTHLGGLVVHSSCVNIQGKAALFVGRTGLGKSTLGASFLRHGYGLMGDDATILRMPDDYPTARAVYPSLRLYHDSVSNALYQGRDAAVPPPERVKQRLDATLQIANDKNCLRLGGIFFLNDEAVGGAPKVHAKRPSAACLGLIEHSFLLNPGDVVLAGKLLNQAAKIASHVPAFDLAFDRNYADLGDVRRLICATLEGTA